jgi:predicted metal-dependent phosphoesterase TrpH
MANFTLGELVDKALKRGLDFIFTEHNTVSVNLICGSYVPEGFLVGRGIEVTTFAGHWNAIGLLPYQLIDHKIYGKTDMDACLVAAVEEVHKSDGFTILNHPFAECKCCEWRYLFHEHIDAIEMWNGPWRGTRRMSLTSKRLRSGTYYYAMAKFLVPPVAAISTSRSLRLQSL